MKKVLTIILALCLIMQTLLVGYANESVKNEEFSDINNHWAEEVIKEHHKEGFLKGYPDGTFKPDKEITRGEMITLVNKYFGLKEKSDTNFDDITDREWYAEETAKAKYYGYVEELKVRADERAKREEVVNMLSLILDIEEQKAKGEPKEFKDLREVDEDLKEKIRKFSELGYLKGYGDSTFKPQSTINRAEIMTIVDNMLGYIVTSQEDIDNMPEGVEKVTIINPNIIIENKEIEGNLYISPGVNGSIKIKNSIIRGQIEVSGGTKEQPIHIEDVQAKKIVITKIKKEPKVEIIGKSEIQEIKTKVGTELSLGKETKIKKMEIQGDTKVETKEGSIIEEVIAKAKTEIKGKGDIKKALIENKEVVIEKEPNFVKVEDNIGKVKIGNKTIDSKNDDYGRNSSRGSSLNNNNTSDTQAPNAPETNITAGTYNEDQSIELTAEEGSSIYYTIDGSEPTKGSSKYTEAIIISETATLKAIAVDAAGNVSGVITVEYVIDKVAPNAPEANVAAGTYNEDQSIELIVEEGSSIYYTIDGSEPTKGSSKYTEAITISETATLKAIAIDLVGNKSGVFTIEYVIDKDAPNVPEANVAAGIYNEDQSIELTVEDGSTIYYTIDGSEPTKGSSKYTETITIRETATLKAIAVDAAGNVSGVITVEYVIDKEAPNEPEANITVGTYNADQSIDLTAEEGASIYYTIDGSEPTKGSSKYTEAITISETATLKVIAVDVAGNVSGVITVEYVIDKEAPNEPEANITAGTYNADQGIELTAEEGSTIYYTIDGSEPTKGSSKYTEAITITETATLKAIAVDAAGNVSGVITVEYVIDKEVPNAPEANVAAGTYSLEQSIELTAEEGASIYYTIDGSEPTKGSSKYTGAITITETATLKAIAVDAAGNVSDVVTVEYVIKPKTGFF